jgi:protein-tyrosine-phosphatase
MKVLFVCSGNAYRSPLAEALLKNLRPDLQVDSAGTHVETRVSEEAKRYSARQKAERYVKKMPESLDTKRLDNYDLIIAMERVHRDIILSKFPECRGKILVWDIEDLGFRPAEYVEKISRQIEEKVRKLSESL